MARRERTLLINPSGRRLLDALSTEYPDILWSLIYRDGKEMCMGTKDGIPVVYGIDYDMIVANIR